MWSSVLSITRVSFIPSAACKLPTCTCVHLWSLLVLFLHGLSRQVWWCEAKRATLTTCSSEVFLSFLPLWQGLCEVASLFLWQTGALWSISSQPVTLDLLCTGAGFHDDETLPLSSAGRQTERGHGGVLCSTCMYWSDFCYWCLVRLNHCNLHLF